MGILAFIIVIAGVGYFIYGIWKPTKNYQQLDAQHDSQFGTGEGHL